jgi:hypothetical protein
LYKPPRSTTVPPVGAAETARLIVANGADCEPLPALSLPLGATKTAPDGIEYCAVPSGAAPASGAGFGAGLELGELGGVVVGTVELLDAGELAGALEVAGSLEVGSLEVGSAVVGSDELGGAVVAALEVVALELGAAVVGELEIVALVVGRG